VELYSAERIRGFMHLCIEEEAVAVGLVGALAAQDSMVIVGGDLPVVGLALADALAGRAATIACLFGDGAVAEGEFHECLNLAALWRLPLLLCCENNGNAMAPPWSASTPRPTSPCAAAHRALPTPTATASR
jgi:pyruvate dehydrogenase E1 component alpha subunit